MPRTHDYPGFRLDGWEARLHRPGDDDAGAIQRAHDTLAAMNRAELGRDYNARPRGRIRLPSGSFTLGRSLRLDSPSIALEGEGESTWLRSTFLDARPLVIAGLPRLDPTIAATHKVPGGFATRGTGQLFAIGSPFSNGRVGKDGLPDYFGTVRQLVITIEVQPGANGWPRGVAFASLGSRDGRPSPYLVGSPDPSDGDDAYRLNLALVDSKGDPQYRSATAPRGEGGPCVFTVDLDKGRVTATVGGRDLGTVGDLGQGLSLAPNEGRPFAVNSRGDFTPSTGAQFADFTLTEFSLATELGPLARLVFDGGEPDEVRIAGGDEAASRWTVAHILDPSQFSGPLGAGGIEVSNLRLTGQGHYGANLVLGPVGDFDSRGLTSEGGAYGYASLGAGVSYTSRFDRPRLSGADSAILSISEMSRLRDPIFPSSGRCTVRLWASKFDLYDGFVQHGSPDSAHFLKSHSAVDGGQVAVQGLSIDYEGATYSGSPFVMEGNIDRSNWISLARINGGTMGNAPLLDLVTPNGSLGGLATIDGFATIDAPNGRPTVRGGRLWIGRVNGATSGGQPSARVESSAPYLWQTESAWSIPVATELSPTTTIGAAR